MDWSAPLPAEYVDSHLGCLNTLFGIIAGEYDTDEKCRLQMPFRKFHLDIIDELRKLPNLEWTEVHNGFLP